MKKVLTTAAVVVLGASAFTFAAGPLPEKNSTITVWETPGTEGQFIQYAAKEFEKQFAAENVHVNFVPVQANLTISKMETAVQTGQGAADVFVFMSDQLGNAINGGLIMPDIVNSQMIQKNFMPAAVQAATGPDGRIYGFPMSIQTYAMYYNKKYFPNGVQTFEQLITFAKTYNNATNSQYALMFDASNFYYSGAFYQMYGAKIFGTDGAKYNPSALQINSAAAIQGIQAMISLKPATQSQIGQGSANNMMGLFGQGKVAAMIDGPLDVQRAQSTGVDFGICPLPTLNGKHPISFSEIRLMGVNQNTKAPMTAQIFAAFCTSPAMEKARFQIVGETPAITALAADQTITQSPLAAAFAQQAKYSVPLPNIPAMAAVWTPMQAAVASAWNGQATTTDALNNAQNTIIQQIKMAYSSN